MISSSEFSRPLKPICILNTKGFYNHLYAFLDTLVTEGMLKLPNRELLLAADEAEDLIQKMMDYEPIVAGKWIA